MSLRGKTAFITGASRGIGLEIAKSLATRGANVAVAAKTTEPHPKLPGTIHTAVEEINQIGERNGSGAKGLAIQLDVRDADAVKDAIDRTVGTLGNLDIVINNASAINVKPTVEASVKSYDLMNNINSRGTWLVSRFALPHLLKSASESRNPHILTLSPTLTYSMLSASSSRGGFPSQFSQTASAYTIAKFGMSLNTLALAAETMGKVGVNSLWPYTLIGTSAMKIVSPNSDVEEKRWRSPKIVSEAAVRVLEEYGATFSAQFLVDEIYLRRKHGFTDEQIAEFSLGGKETPLESLAEDLYISQELREDVLRARRGE
ncbi:NAD(P)-binding protein [Violaceomyces palustris]|uniref:NAD(P)-binding protein n=1 Tax=Violaceomyces palustris TaxID=1673888 RepID=A0ACD0P535_9BASI|nr:NAD(P)-binding protein [Violaceomyces palustris]